MNYAKAMWQLYNEIVQPQVDKVVCPITGGLDSRVLAYVLKEKGVKVLSTYLYTSELEHNLRYTQQLASICEAQHDIKRVDHRPSTQRAVIAALSEYYDSKHLEYWITPFNDMATGIGLRRYSHVDFWLTNANVTYPAIDSPYFSRIVAPTNDPRWIGFCYSLPKHQRLFQRCYIDMINEFTPLGEIPRCLDYPNQPPIAINKGMAHYIYHFMKLRRTK